MNKILQAIKKKKIIAIIIVIAIIIAGAYFAFGNKAKVEYTTVKVEKGKLVQTVSETGSVKASKELDLNFLQSGKIAKINVKIGDKVIKDQVLAELDYSSLIINKQKTEASLRSAQANLNKTIAGATNEEIETSQASVNQAKSAYDSAVKELDKTKKSVNETISQAQKRLNDLEAKTNADLTPEEQAVTTAQTNLENTVSTYKRLIDNSRQTLQNTIDSKISLAKIALDNIDRVINDTDAKDVLSIKNISYLNYTKENYSEANSLITIAETSLAKSKLSANNYETEDAADDTAIALNKTFDSLKNCYKALENSITTNNFTQTELDTFKTNINTQTTNITTAISIVQSGKQTLADALLSYDTNLASSQRSLAKAQTDLDNATLIAENSLNTAKTSGDQSITLAESKINATLKAWQLAEAQLAQKNAPARPEDISSAEAQVQQANASLAEVQKQIDNSIIKSPIDGTITKVNYEVGEDTNQSKPVISMLGANNLEIEVLVSESDIEKIQKDQKVEITFDAFPSDQKFYGNIFFVEPAETIIQDVIYYNVKIIFDLGNASIKSGMTANVIITTAEKDNVLIIPNRAIIEKDGKKLARILVGDTLTEIPVAIGLKGDGGMVEALAGVKEGDLAVTFIKTQ